MHTTISGHRHWYEVEGEGAPVLLIMGFGMSGRAWAPQVNALREHHRVAYYDNRGIGETEPSKVPYGFADLAADGLGLLDHLEMERAHIVGVSMGGMVAQHFALSAPERVRSLTLIATHPGGSIRHTVPGLRGLRLFLRANTSRGEKRLEALRHLLYTRAFLEGGQAEDVSDSFSEGAMERFAEPADPTARKSQLKAILTHDTTKKLARLASIPSLVVRPDGDLLVPPQNSDRLHRLLPGSKLLALKNAGHGVTHECADELNRHLLAHFAQADAADPDAGQRNAA